MAGGNVGQFGPIDKADGCEPHQQMPHQEQQSDQQRHRRMARAKGKTGKEEPGPMSPGNGSRLLVESQLQTAAATHIHQLSIEHSQAHT